MIIAIFPESPRIIQRGRLESSVRARGKQNNNRIEKIVDLTSYEILLPSRTKKIDTSCNDVAVFLLTKYGSPFTVGIKDKVSSWEV